MKILITCKSCNKDRLIETNGTLKSSYEKLRPRCHKCGFNKNKSSKTWFKKEQESWTKGKMLKK